MQLLKVLIAILLSLNLSSCTYASTNLDKPEKASLKELVEAAKKNKGFAKVDLRIWCIYQGKDGKLWFGSNGNGVYSYDGEDVVHHSVANGLSGIQVRDIQGDNSGNILVATNSGVSKFDGTKWTKLEIEELKGRDGWRLDPDDVWLVVNPGEGGPCRYDGKKLYRLEYFTKSPVGEKVFEQYRKAGYPADGIYSIFKDRRGHLWFGTAGAGLARYDGKNLSWMFEDRLTTTARGGGFGIRSIFEDKSGDFWITNTRQRFQMKPEASIKDGFSVINYQKKKGLPNSQSDDSENFSYFPSILEDKHGALWLACASDGVWKYDGKTVTRYNVCEGVYVIRIFYDREGRLWAGTLEHGVFIFNGNKFVALRPQVKNE